MKDIRGFEGLYAITEEGRIWSYPKIVARANNPYTTKGTWITPTLVKNGYHLVGLYRDEIQYKFHVHRLVAEAFLSRKVTVNHKNGIKTDNTVQNLEWCTPSQNNLHAKQILKVGAPKGEQTYAAKLTDENVREIRRMAANGSFYREIATKFGIANSGVSRIVNRQHWSHVV